MDVVRSTVGPSGKLQFTYEDDVEIVVNYQTGIVSFKV